MPVTRQSLLIQLRDLTNDARWTEFLRIYRPLIDTCCRQHGVADSARDDIFQDVVCQLVRTIGSFQLDYSKGRFRSWLSTIVINKIRDHYRRQRSNLRVDFDACLNVAVTEPDCRDDASEQAVMLRRACELVQSRSLETTWRCFAEHHLAQRPAAEVAHELNLSVDAVYANTLRTKSRILKLVHKMKGNLGHASQN